MDLSIPLVTSIVGPTISMVGVVISAILLRKQHALHVEINSRLSELLIQTKRASHAEGMEQERQEARTRHEKEIAQ